MFSGVSFLNKKGNSQVFETLTHIFIIVLGLAMLYPVLWMILSSFKPNNLIFSDTSLIPKVFTLENYVKGWKGYAGVTFGRFFTNSLLMCMVAIAANLASCSMAAYAFGRLKFTGKKLWFSIMMITLMLPAHVTLVPRYILFNTFGWVGTYLPILVPRFLDTDAFFVFLIVQNRDLLPHNTTIINSCAYHNRAVYIPLDMGRFLQPSAVPYQAKNIYGIPGASYFCRRCRRGIKLGRSACNGYAVDDTLLFVILLAAEIFRPGHHHDRHQGLDCTGHSPAWGIPL